MYPQVTLMIEENGTQRLVTRSFSVLRVGRTAENDLVLADPGVGRAHLQFQWNNQGLQVVDGGSANGTFVNDTRVVGAITIHPDDVVRVGTARCLIQVRFAPPHLEPQPVAVPVQPAVLIPTGYRAGRNHPNSSPNPSRVPIWAGGVAGFLVLAIIGLLVYQSKSNPTPGAVEPNPPLPVVSVSEGTPTDFPRVDSMNLPEVSPPPVSTSLSLEQALEDFVSRITSDSRSYVLPTQAVDCMADVSAAITRLRNSTTLAKTLRELNQSSSLASQIRKRSLLKPVFVVCAALAVSNGGTSGSDVAEMCVGPLLTSLDSLGVKFGISSGEDVLFVVAAYAYGQGTEKFHPLRGKDRNVWLLHQHGKISPESYQFLIKFLACGIVATHPQQYQIDAAPLIL